MEFRNLSQVQPPGKFLAQIVPGVIESLHRQILRPLVPLRRDQDGGMAESRHHLDTRHVNTSQAGVVQLEADDL